MKKILCIFALILIGCSSKDNDIIENIEFMSYNWNVKKTKNKNEINFYPKCELYSLINRDGTNKTYSCVYNPNKFEECFESTVDKKIIDSLIFHTNKLIKISKSEIDYSSNIGCVKSPPILRIRINYKNRNSQSYYFNFTNINSEYSSLKKLYFALEVTRIAEEYQKIINISDLVNKKDQFLKFSIKEDTTAFSKPKKVEFIPQG